MSILILTLCLSHCSTIDTADVGLAIIQEYMASDKMKITRRHLRQIIQEELSKAAPFGSGMKQTKLDKDRKELVGHT